MSVPSLYNTLIVHNNTNIDIPTLNSMSDLIAGLWLIATTTAALVYLKFI